MSVTVAGSPRSLLTKWKGRKVTHLGLRLRLLLPHSSWRLWFDVLQQVRAGWVRAARQGTCHYDRLVVVVVRRSYLSLTSIIYAALQLPACCFLSLLDPWPLSLLLLQGCWDPWEPCNALGNLREAVITLCPSFSAARGKPITWASQGSRKSLILHPFGIWNLELAPNSDLENQPCIEVTGAERLPCLTLNFLSCPFREFAQLMPL